MDVKMIVCDDIREEKTGKLTLVGVYPENVMNLLLDPSAGDSTQFPTAIPMLSLYMVLKVNKEEIAGLSQYKLFLYLNNETSHYGNATGRISHKNQEKDIMLVVRFAPFVIKDKGDIRLKLQLLNKDNSVLKEIFLDKIMK